MSRIGNYEKSIKPLVIVIPPEGSSVEDCNKVLDSIKQAQLDDREVIIICDSSGATMARCDDTPRLINFNNIEFLPNNDIKPTFVKL